MRLSPRRFSRLLCKTARYGPRFFIAEKNSYVCLVACVRAHVYSSSKFTHVRACVRLWQKGEILNPADIVLQVAAANNAWSAQQAKAQMDFQERMSNTAHQREIADLRAAGLNPVLSAKLGGASTPSGAMGDTDTSATSSILEALNAVASGAASGAAYGFSSRSSAKDVEDSGLSGSLEEILHIAADALPYRWRKSANSAIDLIFDKFDIPQAVSASSSSSVKKPHRQGRKGSNADSTKTWKEKAVDWLSKSWGKR